MSTEAGVHQQVESKAKAQKLRATVAGAKWLPDTAPTPNPTTIKAMKELDAGKAEQFDNAEEMFRDLGI